MYISDKPIVTEQLNPDATAAQAPSAKLPSAIYALGLTSLLTDLSSEMVASVLPLYLFVVLRLSPMELGVVDGLYNGATALVRLASAYISDRAQMHKGMAMLGYGLSALSRLSLIFTGTAAWVAAWSSAWVGIAGVVLLDRIGKGIRTAPRDALIANHAPPGALARAFGVHRGMDAVGAVLGPLVATAILLYLPQRFDVVFMTSFACGMLGLLVLGGWVNTAKKQPTVPNAVQMSLKGTATALTSRPFLKLCAVAGILSLLTVSDNLMFLTVQQKLGFKAAYLPLLYAASGILFMVFAPRLGRWADRYGARRIMLWGYGALLVSYGVLSFMPDGAGEPFTPTVHNVLLLVTFLLALGAYYAATDGVITAFACHQLDPNLRATGLALIASCVSVGKMLSSFIYGYAWSVMSTEHALWLFSVGLVIALAAAMYALHGVADRAAVT